MNFLKSFGSQDGGRNDSRGLTLNKPIKSAGIFNSFNIKQKESVSSYQDNQQANKNYNSQQGIKLQKSNSCVNENGKSENIDSAKNEQNSQIFNFFSQKLIKKPNQNQSASNLNDFQEIEREKQILDFQNPNFNGIKKVPTKDSDQQKIKNLMEENKGLRFKIDELQEDKMQLKENLKVNKETIQKLTDIITLQQRSFQTPNEIYGDQKDDLSLIINKKEEQRSNSIKDIIIQQQLNLINQQKQNRAGSIAFNSQQNNGSPQNLKFLNHNKNMIRENSSSQKVPILNLSTLKHVKEYTSQPTTLLEGVNNKKNQQDPDQSSEIMRPDQIQKDNQWYHYSTKLELNIKYLRRQIDESEKKFDIIQNQLESEIMQKEKLQLLNLKLTKILKQQSGASINYKKVDENQILNAYNSNDRVKQGYKDQQNIYQTYDGRQNINIENQQFKKIPIINKNQMNNMQLLRNKEQQFIPQKGQTNIQIHNLNHLYHNNQYYSMNNPSESNIQQQVKDLSAHANKEQVQKLNQNYIMENSYNKQKKTSLQDQMSENMKQKTENQKRQFTDKKPSPLAMSNMPSIRTADLQIDELNIAIDSLGEEDQYRIEKSSNFENITSNEYEEDSLPESDRKDFHDSFNFSAMLYSGHNKIQNDLNYNQKINRQAKITNNKGYKI